MAKRMPPAAAPTPIPALAPTESPEFDELLLLDELLAVEVIEAEVVKDVCEVEEAEDVDVDVDEHPADCGMFVLLEPQTSFAASIDTERDSKYISESHEVS